MTLSPAEFAAVFDEEFKTAWATAESKSAASRRSAIDHVGIDVLVELALAPTWTVDVVEASGLVSADALDTLVAAGLMTHNAGRYVVPEKQARDLLSSGGSQDSTVVEHLSRVGAGITKAQQANAEVPAVLSRFARLTDGVTSAGEVATRLIDLVDAAVKKADVSDAVNWIQAAARLELGLGRELVGARLRAGRLVAQKRRDDELQDFSSRYFARPHYEEPLQSLKEGSSQFWARHLRGDGGTGKTMLVRWLEAGFPSDGSAGSVARIDFDYLHPNYPGTEPGLLVLTLAAQLQFFAGAEAKIRFERLEDHIADWHTRIEEAERTHPADVAAIRAERAPLVQGAFAEAVSALPAPVVVILDTTEELEKAAGGQANVQAALDVVTRLHEASPSVRVVLSGRRRLPLPTGAEELVVVGFEPGEATRFVKWFDVDDKRAQAIVTRVAAMSADGDLSPFDLALLATWARDDPQFGLQAIVDMDDSFYVEHRIIGRLGSAELERVLPVVVALGRFDVATLGAVTGAEGPLLDRLVAAVTRQEWVDVESGSLLVVDPHLRRRLMDYLNRNRRVAWTEARRGAASYLREYGETALRSAVTVEHLTGAIELTEDEDEIDLVAWWGRIEERARAEAAFGWLEGVSALLLGAGGAVGHAHPLAGPVTASYVACLDHEAPDPVTGHREMWREVYEKSEAGSRSAARGAAHLEEAIEPAFELWAERLDEQLGASFIAGLEQLVDNGDDWSALATRLFQATIDRELGPELFAMSSCLVGRAYAARGERSPCRTWLVKAVELAEMAVGGQSGNEWIDWPVDDVGARIRLWATATWWPRFGKASQADEWFTHTGDRIRTVDQDREAALATQVALASGRVGKAPAASLGLVPVSPFVARVPIHLQTPSGAVTRALVWARRGDVDRALSDVHATNSDRASSEEYLMAERARMALVRRYRLRDIGEGVSTGLADSLDPADVALLKDLDAFDGPPVTGIAWWTAMPTVSRAAGAHAWWRTVRAGTEIPFTLSPPFLPKPNPPARAADAHCLLDDVERALMFGRPEPPLPDLTPWLGSDPVDAEDALRLVLRRFALTGDLESNANGLAQRLGRNHAAEIALDEGDSLALRLPLRAGPLLGLAGRWFATAWDPFGEVRAWAAAALASLAVPSRPGGTPSTAQQEAVAELAEAYRRATRAIDLPLWDDLLDLTSDPVGRAPRSWRPWLIRCAVVRVATEGGRVRGDLDALLRRHLSTLSDRQQPVMPTDISQAARSSLPWLRAVTQAGGLDSTNAANRPVVLELEALDAPSSTRIMRSGTVRVVRHAGDESRPAASTNEGQRADEVIVKLPPGLADRERLQGLIADLDLARPVEFLQNPDVGAPAWEFLVAATPMAANALDRPMWRRIKRSSPRPINRARRWRVAAIAGEADMSLARCWRDVYPASVVEVDVIPSLASASVHEAAVLHLIGQAVEGRRGVSWVSGPDGSLGSVVRSAPSKEPFGRESLPAAEILARSEPDLVLIQGIPDHEFHLDTWSREQAAYFRQLGTDLAQGGVPAVIVLPGFGLPVWDIATRALVEALEIGHHQTLSPSRLIRAVREVRLAVAGPPDRDRGFEDALGACLFMSDSVISIDG
jgi:hypothetical protein